MTVSFDPIKALIRREYLYNMSEHEKGCYTSCSIIAASAYKGQTLTFTVLVQDRYIYSDVPISALVSHQIALRFDLKQLAAVNCPAFEIEHYSIKAFENRAARIFIKGFKDVLVGKYICTFDFYTDNELLNLMVLDEGQFILVPNHKLDFNLEDKISLPDYKKNRNTWRI